MKPLVTPKTSVVTQTETVEETTSTSAFQDAETARHRLEGALRDTSARQRAQDILEADQRSSQEVAARWSSLERVVNALVEQVSDQSTTDPRREPQSEASTVPATNAPEPQ